MEYSGRYKAFDPSLVETYPLKERPNKVTLDHLVLPAQVDRLSLDVAKKVRESIETVAEAIISAHRDRKPVIIFTGAHLIKNGMGPLLADLVDRRIATLVAGTGATAIHDFELALIGQTSEDVPAALGQGWFGMAYEFAYINTALSIGNRQRLGFGESLSAGSSAMMLSESRFWPWPRGKARHGHLSIRRQAFWPRATEMACRLPSMQALARTCPTSTRPSMVRPRAAAPAATS